MDLAKESDVDLGKESILEYESLKEGVKRIEQDNNENSGINRESPLINNNPQHQLTIADRIKGGQSRSIQKSISAKLRVYSNPNLNCQNCKHRCTLYDSQATDCSKKEILLNLRELARSTNPEGIFLELFDTMSEMKTLVYSKQADEDLSLKFGMLKVYVDKLSEIFRLKFGIKLENQIQPNKISLQQIHRIAKLAQEAEKESISLDPPEI